jgi:hypothetical protein
MFVDSCYTSFFHLVKRNHRDTLRGFPAIQWLAALRLSGSPQTDRRPPLCISSPQIRCPINAGTTGTWPPPSASSGEQGCQSTAFVTQQDPASRAPPRLHHSSRPASAASPHTPGSCVTCGPYPACHQFPSQVLSDLHTVNSRKYGLEKEFKINVECNHATLSGDTAHLPAHSNCTTPTTATRPLRVGGGQPHCRPTGGRSSSAAAFGSPRLCCVIQPLNLTDNAPRALRRNNSEWHHRRPQLRA